MNATSNLSLHHVRSVGAVVRDGYLLYTSNFKRLFRASWIYALLYALAFAWMTSRIIYDVLPLIVISQYPSLEVRWTASTADWILVAIYCLAFVITALLLAAVAIKATISNRILMSLFFILVCQKPSASGRTTPACSNSSRSAVLSTRSTAPVL